jgi:hypothetical protein
VSLTQVHFQHWAAAFFFLLDDAATTVVATSHFLKLPELEGSMVRIGVDQRASYAWCF